MAFLATRGKGFCVLRVDFFLGTAFLLTAVAFFGAAFLAEAFFLVTERVAVFFFVVLRAVFLTLDLAAFFFATAFLRIFAIRVDLI
jgi:hypothetical protein